MAEISAAFSGRSNISLHMVVTESSTNQSTNTSVVSIGVYLLLDSASALPYDLGTSSTWSASVNGTPYSGSYSYDFRGQSAGYTQSLLSTTQSVTHNSDGTKTISFDCSSSAASPLGSADPSAGSLALTTFYFFGKRRTSSSTWVTNTTGKRWNGSSWVAMTTAKRWNGSSWVNFS